MKKALSILTIVLFLFSCTEKEKTYEELEAEVLCDVLPEVIPEIGSLFIPPPPPMPDSLQNENYKISSDEEFFKLVNEEKGLEWMTYERVSCDEIRGVEHWYVYQRTVGMEGDSFEGFLLLPLKNGKYFKVSYSC